MKLKLNNEKWTLPNASNPTQKAQKKNLESHGKQHGGHKCKQITPLTAQYNA